MLAAFPRFLVYLAAGAVRTVEDGSSAVHCSSKIGFICDLLFEQLLFNGHIFYRKVFLIFKSLWFTIPEYILT